MTPQHSIDFCPICGGGLCGVRICGLNSTDTSVAPQAHGLVICDECEAIWFEPDLSTDHVYVDPIDSRCPLCQQSLWGEQSRWANESDLKTLGWTESIDRELDVPEDHPDQGYKTGEGLV